MISHFVIALWILLGLQPTSIDNLEIDAVSAYQRNDFHTAAVLYEQLVARGLEGSALRFNLATAYFQGGDLGHAVINYRRSLRWMPRDGEVIAGLDAVRRAREDVIPDGQSLIDVFNSVFTIEEAFWIVWGSGVVTASVFLLGSLLSGKWHRFLRGVLMTSLFIILIMGSLTIGSLWFETFRPPAVVVEERVYVYSGPGEQYLELFLLHAGAEIRRIDSTGGWIRFELSDGREGWLPATAVEFVR